MCMQNSHPSITEFGTIQTYSLINSLCSIKTHPIILNNLYSNRSGAIIFPLTYSFYHRQMFPYFRFVYFIYIYTTFKLLLKIVDKSEIRMRLFPVPGAQETQGNQAKGGKQG